MIAERLLDVLLILLFLVYLGEGWRNGFARSISTIAGIVAGGIAAFFLIPLVTQLYKDQIGNNPQLGAADAGFMTDNRTGRLIVTARGDQMKIIEDVFSRLLTTTAI